MSFQFKNEIDLADEYLGGNYLNNGDYRYFAHETGTWYVVDTFDLADLGSRLAQGEPDAYSFWCGDTDMRVFEEEEE